MQDILIINAFLYTIAKENTERSIYMNVLAIQVRYSGTADTNNVAIDEFK